MHLRWPLVVLTMGFGLVAACGGSERGNGFGQDGTEPENPGSGPFSNGAPPTSGPNECAKSEAEAKKPPVDIILSVDQSGSMSDDLVNVKNNINRLATFLDTTGLDYRVVMIGTPGNGTYEVCVPPPLGGPGCTSNGTVFRAVPQHLESNDTLSLILSTLEQPSSSPTAWKDFLRPDAVKVFVPITDDNSYLQATAFDTQLLSKHGALFGSPTARRYMFFPITGAAAYPAKTTCGAVAVNNGSVYLELAILTKGKWFPICLTNFGPVFQEIGQNIASAVACELPVPMLTNGGVLDPERVNVTVVPGKGGSEKEIYQDTTRPCDQGADGWQYNSDKSKILLCGDACEAVRSDNGAKVSVQFGCATRVK